MSSENNETEESAIEAERAKSGFWFTEDIAPGLKIEAELIRIICSTQSPFQKIDVIETYFGKTLVTDGKTQSAELDEYVYHESLVHPPMLKSAMLSPDDSSFPKSVFIGGGGELATAREVLRHKSVERCVMVDLDEKVIEVCKRHLPEWGGDAVCSDPRFELVVGDAHAYMRDTKETFDVIIMDISDPIEAGPGIMLYTKEFYEHAMTRLNMPHGVFVTQSGSADSVPPNHSKESLCFGPIYNTLRNVFDCVAPYSSSIPSFGGEWGFIMAFNDNTADEKTTEQYGEVSPGKIDELIDKNVTHMKDVVGQKCGEDDDVLDYYDGMAHRKMFSLAKPLKKDIDAEERIMTKDNPIFMY